MIIVEPYNPSWPEHFERLRSRLLPAFGAYAISIEHVGSTSVPGLSAKPIIDLDVIVAPEHLDGAIEAMLTLGYTHRGELGISGRHAFSYVGEVELPRHNAYVCVEGADALQNHLLLRDRLRADDDAARAYGDLKKTLAREFPDDIDAYIDGKTAFIVGVLAQQGMDSAALDDIERANVLSNSTSCPTPEAVRTMRALLHDRAESEVLRVRAFASLSLIEGELSAADLAAILGDPSQPAVLRGEAADKIGGRDLHELFPLVIQTLNEPDLHEEVAFWCLYACAVLARHVEVTEAHRRVVKRYVGDSRAIAIEPQVATLDQEARWALDRINGGESNPEWSQP